MTDYAAFWMAACRRAFPGVPAYLCTGGADDDTPTGARFSAQAKAAARHGGGIRLTNEVNKFDDINEWLERMHRGEVRGVRLVADCRLG